MTESTALAEPTVDTETDETRPPTDTYREVRFRHSKHFVPVLQSLQSSLLVSTYSAGKLAAVGVSEGKLDLSFHNFEQAMGVAVRPGCMAVGAKGQIWFLKDGAIWRLAWTGGKIRRLLHGSLVADHRQYPCARNGMGQGQR